MGCLGGMKDTDIRNCKQLNAADKEDLEKMNSNASTRTNERQNTKERKKRDRRRIFRHPRLFTLHVLLDHPATHYSFLHPTIRREYRSRRVEVLAEDMVLFSSQSCLYLRLTNVGAHSAKES